jgi:hypothetical protein
VPKATRSTTIKSPTGGITIEMGGGAAPAAGPTIEQHTEPKKDFWEQQQVLDTAEGKDYVIYLYRLQPAMQGLKGAIAKFSKPVDMEEIKESFGGYEYRISLHKGRTWVCSDVFSIAAPPKAVGVADPAMLTMGGSMPVGGGNATETTAQLNATLQFLRAQLESERKEKANDPAYVASLSLVQKQAEAAITAAYSRMENQPGQAAQQQIMQMMMQQMGAIMTALLNRGLQPPEKASVSGIKELLELLPLFGIKLGGGTGVSKVDPLAAIGESLINAAPRILEAGAGFMDRYRLIAEERTKQSVLQYNAIAIQRGAQPAPVNVTTRDVATHPAAAPTAQPAQQHQQPANNSDFPVVDMNRPTAAAAAPAAASPQGFDETTVKQRIVQMVHQGFSGDVLMAFITGVNETFAVTMKACTEAQIRTYFAGDPILSQALASPNFDECLAGAIYYLHPEGAPLAAASN